MQHKLVRPFRRECMGGGGRGKGDLSMLLVSVLLVASGLVGV
jgi:hypothetical protein